MHLKLVLCFLASFLGLAKSQYSFGLAVDDPEQFGASLFQPTFTTSRSREISRGASQTASRNAARRPSSRADGKTSSHSIASFVFSGLEDATSAPQQTPRRQQQQIQHQFQQFEPQRQPQQTFRRQQTSRNVQRERTTPAPEENEINEVTIGKSPCARGAAGEECRKHIQVVAMSCTSGKCHECQQCGSVSAKDWITCCRDHFLCCRPLARSCQRCDQPSLTPFCNIAFGKCV